MHQSLSLSFEWLNRMCIMCRSLALTCLIILSSHCQTKPWFIAFLRTTQSVKPRDPETSITIYTDGAQRGERECVSTYKPNRESALHWLLARTRQRWQFVNMASVADTLLSLSLALQLCTELASLKLKTYDLCHVLIISCNLNHYSCWELSAGLLCGVVESRDNRFTHKMNLNYLEMYNIWTLSEWF